jgi:hypothetical protein
MKCQICQKEKDASEFTKLRYDGVCDDCEFEIWRAHQDDMRDAEYVNEMECSMCGKEGATPHGKKGEMFCSTCWMIWTS